MDYSSLAYLRRLPPDTLKLDRRFIARLGNEADDVQFAQGFYFSRPVDRSDFGELLRDPERIKARLAV